MLTILLLLAALAGVAPAMTRRWRWGAHSLALAPLTAGLSIVWLSWQPESRGAAWAPALGVSLSFSLDGLGVLFALLICGIGTVVYWFAASYLEGDPRTGSFFCVLLLFTASMLGVALADNVIALFVFWELTSLTSFLLIGYDHERLAARDAALKTLLVTGLGGLALLAGLLLLAMAGGSFELSALNAAGGPPRGHPFYLPALALIALGAFAKSAQFPFHFWLPAAMEAPTPVSAYLHSATMVKAGVYLLARLLPSLGGTEAWTLLVGGVGGATMLLGFAGAFPQRDAKRLLAYSTIGALGMLTMLIGLGTPAAVYAAMAVLLAHALYKAALFLSAGALDHATGTRDVYAWSGLWGSMRPLALTVALAAASLAGLPPLFGYVAKEQMLGALPPPAAAAVWLAGVLSVAVAALLAVRPLGGVPIGDAHAPSAMLWGGPALLAVLGAVFGCAPGLADASLVSPAAAAVAPAHGAHLALWHGFGAPLYLSLAMLAGGLVLYRWREPALGAAGRLAALAGYGPERLYRESLRGALAFAAYETRLLQSGKLRNYVLIVLTTAAAVGFHSFWSRGGVVPATDWSDLKLHEAALAAVAAVAVFAALLSESRLAAVIALGAVGLVVALVFLLFGAPDLAITQFAIETLTVILLVLVLYHLPKFATLSSRRERLRDLLVAASAGALLTLLVLGAAGVAGDPALSGYYSNQSAAQAHGRNVVNVILVDFRALDTLGEITVLAVAAIAVYALLKLRLGKGEQA